MVGRLARLVVTATLAGCAAAPAAVSPVPLSVIRPFGDRHAGLDLRAPVGTPVLAAADGEVLRVDERRAAGKLVLVKHAPDLTTAYMHLSDVSVRPGQEVRRGKMLGRSGTTGNATTPHLHFGVCRRSGGRCDGRIDGGWDDPTVHWIAGSPCFEAGRDYGETPRRLTYPLPCRGD